MTFVELYLSDYHAHCRHKPPEPERRRRLLALPRLLASPSLRAVLLIRVANASPRFTWWFWRNCFVHLYGMDWSGRFELGPEFELPHPLGTCLPARARIGSSVGMGHNVTLGGDNAGNVPRIGDRVTIYPGAVIVGGVTIGDDCVISANAVVQRDVPPSRLVTQRGMLPLEAARTVPESG